MGIGLVHLYSAASMSQRLVRRAALAIVALVFEGCGPYDTHAQWLYATGYSRVQDMWTCRKELLALGKPSVSERGRGRGAAAKPRRSRDGARASSKSAASRGTSAACTLRSRRRTSRAAIASAARATLHPALNVNELRNINRNAPASPHFRAPRHGPRGPHGGARAPPDVAQGAQRDKTRPRRARRRRGAPEHPSAANVRR